MGGGANSGAAPFVFSGGLVGGGVGTVCLVGGGGIISLVNGWSRGGRRETPPNIFCIIDDVLVGRNGLIASAIVGPLGR